MCLCVCVCVCTRARVCQHNMFSCCVDLHPIKDEKAGTEGLYWLVDYPWPLWDRDVSLNCSVLTSTSVCTVGLLLVCVQ